jgi:hypothetical protein
MSPGDRRALAIGVGVLAAAWLILRGLPDTIVRVEQLRHRTEARRSRLRDTREALAGLSSLEDSSKALIHAVAAMAPRLLSGETAELAARDFTGRLNTLASLHHARVGSPTVLPDSTRAGPLRRVTIKAALETDFPGLISLLQVLANGQPVVVVEHLEIKASEPWAAPDSPERLVVEMRATAWYLTRKSS